METISFDITNGDLIVKVTITENADGTLTFDLAVQEDTGFIGDLNGLFFDLADDTIADNLVVSGTDLTGDNIEANKVTKVDSWNNVNGEVVKEDGRFDVGVQFGTSGMAADDIQSTSFTMSTSDGSALSIADIVNQDFAVRLTSVGEIDGSRDGSVKISGTSEPEYPPEPPCPDAAIGNDDFMFALSNDAQNPFGTDIIGIDENGLPISKVIANDTNLDGSAYGGVIYTADGLEVVDQVTLTGSNGGQLILYANGGVDFIANGDFDYLTDEATAQTTFTYGVECGDLADIVVTVSAAGGDGGGGGVFF